MPVMTKSPATVNFAIGVVVPIPNLLLVLSQNKPLSPLIEEVAVKKETWPAEPEPDRAPTPPTDCQVNWPEPLVVKT